MSTIQGKKKVYLFWTTADGKKMNIDEMDDTHVRNAFKQLLRNIDALQKAEKQKRVRSIFQLNGEMAIASIEENEIDNDEPYAYDYLWRENH